jgi:succinyl-diaminopimelate desuccinylase
MNAEEEKLLSLVDKEELISLTRELVRIDSVIRRDEDGNILNSESGVVAFITDWIEKNLKVKPLVREVAPGRENIIAVVDFPEEGPCLMFEGHTDVVSEGDSTLWKHDPFGAELDDGKIYGRGSCDMKAGLAVNLLTVKHLMDSGTVRRGRIVMGIVCDEEGMMVGIKDFIKQGHADGVDGCLVSEPEENQLCLSMKGAVRAIVRVKGKMAHGAMPRTGINPNTRMARVILAFEEYEQEEITRCGEDEFLGFPSITFTVVQSPPPGQPAQLNVMPGESIGYVDIRTVPAQDHDTIRGRLQTILDSLGRTDTDFRGSIDFIEDRPVVTMEKEEPIVQAAISAFRDVTGKEPVFNSVPGATDGTFLRAWKGIPCLVNGPGPRHMPHQTDEYVDVDELYEAARIYALTACRFLHK